MSNRPNTTAAAATATRRDPDPIDTLDLATGHCAVVGLQWGDEGKGKIVDLLAPRFDLVVRYNGGANAGHSVQVDDTRYALHLIPSGILYPDKLNVLANGVVIDPQQLCKEIEELRGRDIAVGDNFRISNRAHVVLPYHKLEDALLEAALGHAHGDAGRIGTTGRGIGPCYADKALRTTAIRVGDLLNAEHLHEKLAHIVRIKNRVLGALADLCDQPFEPLDADALCRQYADFGKILGPHVCDATTLLHDAIADGRKILFEGANATLLDIDHGTYPFVTSSNCSLLGVPSGTGVPGHQIKNVVGVVKAYTTRVGGGPMPTQLDNDIGNRLREAGREYGTTTGRPRRCGWLDLVALKYAAAVSGASCLALMLLDVLAGFENLNVCVGYRYQGQHLANFPADAGVLEAVEPIYDQVSGFGTSVDHCRRFDDLPSPARDYIRFIEEHVGVPVRIVSVGPRRDQTLIRLTAR